MKLASWMLCVASIAGLTVVVGCRPVVDGGWSGDADCGNNLSKVDAIFNEDNQRNLDGVVYIDNVFGGLAARGEVEDGEVKDDGSYGGKIESDGDSKPDFEFDFAYDDKDVDTVRGHVDVLDNDGKTTDSCKLKLERQTVND